MQERTIDSKFEEIKASLNRAEEETKKQDYKNTIVLWLNELPTFLPDIKNYVDYKSFINNITKILKTKHESYREDLILHSQSSIANYFLSNGRLYDVELILQDMLTQYEPKGFNMMEINNIYSVSMQRISDRLKDHTIIQQKLVEVNKSIELLNESRKLLEEIKKDKISLITLIGLFISVFTFISIDIQILNNVENPKNLIGLVLITAGGLLGFILGIDFVARIWINPNNTQLNLNSFFLYLFALVLVFCGIVIF